MPSFDLFPDNEPDTLEEVPQQVMEHPYKRFLEDVDDIMNNRTCIDDVLQKMQEKE